jgi:hypothetical protein
MATEPALQPLLLGEERATTAAARIWEVIDDLIDLILRLEFAARALMPSCAPGLPGTPPSWRINSFAFASARRSARDFGGSEDGGLELVRES